MTLRTPVCAEDMGIRFLCLVAGAVLLLLPAPARAQEAQDPEAGAEATEDTGTTEGVAPADAAEKPEEPKADPRAEARRKKEEAAAARRKKDDEKRAKIKADRKAAAEKKAADRQAAIEKKAAARQAAIDKKAAARKAKLMKQKRRLEEAQRKKGVKGRDSLILDDLTLAELRKPENQLRLEARIKAARVTLPPDMKLEYLWSLPLERPVAKGDIWVHPDIILLLADKSVLYCIRKRDGVPMWAIELGDTPLYPPAVGARMVYVFVKNVFIGIDRTRGEVIWKINPGFAPSATPCVSEPNIYIPAWDNRVYAVQVIATKRVFGGGRANASLTMTEHRIREIWHKTTGGYVLGTPVLLDGFVYFGSEDGYLYSVNQDGEDRYSAQTQGPIRAPLTARGAKVYVGSSDFSAYAFDRLTGNNHWTYPTGSHVLSAIYPDIPSGVAFVGSNKNGFFGIDDRPTPEAGTELWHIPDAVSIAGVSEDFAYFNLSDKRLAAVEKRKGTVQWVSLLDGIREVVPTMNDWTRSGDQFRLICVTDSGHLACLRESKETVRRALKARK